MMRTSLLAVLFLLASGTAPAGANADEGKPKPAKPISGSKLICRTETDIGTRLGRGRACHTQAEWDDLRRQTKLNVENIQNSRAWNSGG